MGLAIEVIRTDTGEHETFSCASSPVRIGRSPLNNVVLQVPWVSLHHGLIHFDTQKATYSDLGSTNGTNVFSNDQEMKLHPMVPVQILGPGNVDADIDLRIGAISMRIRWDHSAGAGDAYGGKRGFDTRLTHSEASAPLPPQAPTVDPPYGQPSHGSSRNDPPMSYGGTPPGRPGVGNKPLYNAGNTRMAGPGEQERIKEIGAGAAPLTPVSVGASGPVHDILARLTQGWPGATELHQPGPARAFAETLAVIADALAAGLIELKRGMKEFGEGMGVRAVGGHTPVHRAQRADEMFAYLLDPRATVQERHQRLEQLVDLFADLGIHEVALLAGVKAGVRRLLRDLDPEKGGVNTGSFGILDRSLRRYREHFREIAEDDGASIVFGPDFARAYADALGTDPSKRRG
jgi:hypothetical protein